MPPAFEVQDITVRFGGLVAVDKASLTIQKGDLIGFIGPNGAGKTTLMRVITGIVTPTEGKVMLYGRDLSGLTINQRIRAGMALAQQIVQPLRKMTLVENVALAAGGAKTANPLSQCDRSTVGLSVRGRWSFWRGSAWKRSLIQNPPNCR